MSVISRCDASNLPVPSVACRSSPRPNRGDAFAHEADHIFEKRKNKLNKKTKKIKRTNKKKTEKRVPEMSFKNACISGVTSGDTHSLGANFAFDSESGVRFCFKLTRLMAER